MDMWTNGPYSPIPVSWMNRWYAGPDGQNIAQRENDWQLDNTQRYQNPEYDALYEELLTKRNANWVVKIEEMLRGSGTAFIAVGAGHLIGPDSVQVQLKAKGIVAILSATRQRQDARALPDRGPRHGDAGRGGPALRRTRSGRGSRHP